MKAAVLFLAAVALDALALRALLGGGWVTSNAMAEGVLLHGGGVAAAAAAAAGSALARRLARSARLALALGICVPLPLVGVVALAALCGILRYIRPIAASHPFLIGESQILTDPAEARGFAETRQSILGVLRTTDNEMRRRAVLALRCVDPKNAIPILQKAIQDSDEQVRLLAQAQFNRILSKIEATIKQLEADLSAPDPSPIQLVRLAEYYHELVYLGLASEESEAIYLQRAIGLLEQFLRLEPDTQTARLSLLRLQTRKRDLPAARRTLRELIDSGYQSEFLFPWEAELVYQERNWPELARSLEVLRECRLPDPRLRSLIEFWLERGKPAPQVVYG